MITTHTQPVVDTETALRAVEIALRVGAAAGVAVCVAVAGPGMELVAFAKAPTATPHSVFTSQAKASTAASTRRETGWMGPDLETAIPVATGGRLTNIIGGVPLAAEDGTHVGGLGVAGGTPAQDLEIARATLQELGRT